MNLTVCVVFEEIFLHDCEKLRYLSRTKRLSRGIGKECTEIWSPAVRLHRLLQWLSSAGLQKPGNRECPWHMRYDRKKIAETRGISGGSEAGCSISPSFKTYCQALLRLGPMCLAMNNRSQRELMKQLSESLAINQLSKFYSAWVVDGISVGIE